MYKKLLMISFLFCGAAEIEPEREILYRSFETGLVLEAFTGSQARFYRDAIAAMRINLFREYPYLYLGNNIEEEHKYLETYFTSTTSRILLLFDKDRVVGFSNSLSLAEESVEVQAPFLKKGLNPKEYLYIGEAMLNPEYRKKNIIRVVGAWAYHQMRARKCGCNHISFMTVDRPEDHPSKPADYESLELVWKYYGFKKMEDMKIHYQLPQVDTKKVENNILSVWCKKIEIPD